MGKSASKPGRVFLVGCPRSGTTLLQCFLGAHPEIATFPESHFFVNLVGQWATRICGAPRQDFTGRLGHRLADCRTALGVTNRLGRARVMQFLEEVERPDLAGLFPKGGRSLRQQSEACFRILDTLAVEQKKPLWLEKTPDHLGYIDVIERYAGPVKFLHLVRSGADVVASLYDAHQRYPTHWPSRYDTLDKCITNWNHAANLTARYMGRPNHLLVRYENLVANPEAEMRAICAFLDTNFDRGMLQDHREVAKQVVLSWEGWKAGAGGAVANANGTKFQQLFTPEQRQYILDRLVAAPGDPEPKAPSPPADVPANQYA